jgi:glycine cleavage system aminomethyltransferase T
MACAPARPLWLVTSAKDDHTALTTHFIDFQRDQTVADVQRAMNAGMRSVEHIKRYTSISTANDQGKTSAVNAIGAIASVLGEAADLGQVGHTTFRAPFAPVPFAALAGRRKGELFDPARITSIHSWHVAHGAEFEDVGQWKRPWYYPKPGEDMDAAVLREGKAVRESVGFQDASTLGKIEIRGTDAGEFLGRIYTNGFKKLKVGKGRYGLMCKPDGMIFDDGVTLRVAEDRYYMTTTSGGAATVLEWLEEWHQTEWPELDVVFTSVTEQWATVAVAGPRSREVIAKLAPNLEVSNEAFEFMGFRETTLANGIPARICRISFSGELAFEINVDTFYGLAVWEAVAEAGAEFDITPYGTEVMHVLRAEKGFIIVGQDTDGTVTPADAGMEWIVSKFKDFIGKRSYSRVDTAREDRKHLVGVLPVDGTTRLAEGAQLITSGTPVTPDAGPVPMIGHVTSSYISPSARPAHRARPRRERPQPRPARSSSPRSATPSSTSRSPRPSSTTRKGTAAMADTTYSTDTARAAQGRAAQTVRDRTDAGSLEDLRVSPAAHLADDDGSRPRAAGRPSRVALRELPFAVQLGAAGTSPTRPRGGRSKTPSACPCPAEGRRGHRRQCRTAHPVAEPRRIPRRRRLPPPAAGRDPRRRGGPRRTARTGRRPLGQPHDPPALRCERPARCSRRAAAPTSTRAPSASAPRSSLQLGPVPVILHHSSEARPTASTRARASPTSPGPLAARRDGESSSTATAPVPTVRPVPTAA